jgi:bacterioferritin (cytochrome b1)
VDAELRAEADWSAVADAAEEAGDMTTLHMALAIRAEESEHLRELRGWQRQIELTGAGNFISTHTPGA